MQIARYGAIKYQAKIINITTSVLDIYHFLYIRTYSRCHDDEADDEKSLCDVAAQNNTQNFVFMVTKELVHRNLRINRLEHRYKNRKLQ